MSNVFFPGDSRGAGSTTAGTSAARGRPAAQRARRRPLDPPESFSYRRDDPRPTAPAVPREPLDPSGQALLRAPELQAMLRLTAARHPHLVNRLAAGWEQPDRLLRALDGWLLDDRPQREGFSLPVLQELAELRAHYDAVVAPVQWRLQADRAAAARAAARQHGSAAPRRRAAARLRDPRGWLRRLLGR